ncbi:MAG: SpoIID/LytB domain-containing protein [Chloroflexia bacterium]|nr:SpoIID/LytB domain-containing protein [Chloroflexia bacterium]
MKKVNLFLFLLVFNKITIAQQINIGLFQQLEIDKLFIEASAGKYKIKGDGKKLYQLKNDRNIILKYTNGMISVSNSKKDFGLHTEIEIVARNYNYNKSHNKPNSRKNSELNIKLITPKQDTRTYQGNLNVKVYNKQLEIINQIAMPDYLAGVVEAESGPNEVIEYYKNQAIICRTYALKNLEKHKNEGFHLCDGVHCQAYKGKSTNNKIIPKAVTDTKDLVIVDNDNQLIEALFSANCGGQTNNSEDVWSSALPYLRSIADTFCIDQSKHSGQKKLILANGKTS